MLECDGPISEIGGLAADFGPAAGGDSPDEALASFLREGPFSLPTSDYSNVGGFANRHFYAYDVDGRVKVVVVVS
ncbi:MAG: hypothetical protein M3295_09230, partial [Chloroflexota bacterium]|nr:hypothetical protein [Chloroflexota bacterium]